MPTTHTWKGAGDVNVSTSIAYIYNSTQYTDGQPFQPGDTLVVNSGAPFANSSTVNSATSSVANLTTGNYVFNVPAGNTGLFTGLQMWLIGLDSASTISVSGPGELQCSMNGQFVNGGTVQFGSPTASGSAFVNIGNPSGSTFTLTNNGSITIQNNSAVTLEPGPGLKTKTLVNAAGATLNVKSGSTLNYSSTFGLGTNDTTNNGLITVTGSAGRKTDAEFYGRVQGSGLLSVKGAPGNGPGDTVAHITNAASNIFDITNSELKFDTTPVSGAVNFLDNNGLLYDNYNSGLYATGTPSFGATIYGFQAGDAIAVSDAIAGTLTPASDYTLSWNAGTNVLTLAQSGASLGQFTLAGSYQASDFHLQVAGAATTLIITTTSTANAITPFAVQDITTNAAAVSSPGQQYTGPVNYLQSQYTWTSADKVNVATALPDVYLVGGAGDDALAASAGSNVLDGGLGSNFLTGATGSDGGQDTFFLDGSKGTTWDTIANFHPGDSVTLWGFVPGTSSDTWAASDGTGSYKGATIHAAFAGAGTAVNGSVTFAGITQATQQADFTISSGSSGGRDYLYVHYNR